MLVQYKISMSLVCLNYANEGNVGLQRIYCFSHYCILLLFSVLLTKEMYTACMI